MQRTGTFLDGKRVPANKPTQLKNGSRLSFGTLARTYVLKCEASGVVCVAYQLTTRQI